MELDGQSHVSLRTRWKSIRSASMGQISSTMHLKPKSTDRLWDTLNLSVDARFSSPSRSFSADVLTHRSIMRSVDNIKTIFRKEKRVSLGNEVRILRWILQDTNERNIDIQVANKVFLDEEGMEKAEKAELDNKTSSENYLELLTSQTEREALPKRHQIEITRRFWSEKALQDRLSGNFSNRAVSWILDIDDTHGNNGDEENEKISLKKEENSKMELVRGCGRFDFGDGFKYGGEVDSKELMTHGHGVLIGPCGTFSGLWHQGMQTVGVHTWYIGAKYEGTWKNGLRHGYGVEYRSRCVYEGEWKNDRKTGYGVLRSRCGAKYEGTWLDGTQDGYGVETYADGGFYIGQWHAGVRHGYGVRVTHSHTTPGQMLDILTQLSQYSTDVKNVWSISNFPDDKETQDEEDRQRDEVFDEGGSNPARRNGALVSSPMEVYRGEWESDRRSGFGVLKVSTGTSYEGEWLDNLQNGYGTLTHSNGLVESGKWKDNCRLCIRRNFWSSSIRNFQSEVDKATEKARYAAEETDRKSLTSLQRIEGAKREGDSAVKVSQQARNHSKLADEKLAESLDRPIKKRGRPKRKQSITVSGVGYDGDSTSSGNSNNRPPPSSSPSSSSSISYNSEDRDFLINKFAHPSDSEVLQTSQVYNVYENKTTTSKSKSSEIPDEGSSAASASLHSSELRVPKLRSIDERSEMSCPSNRSSYVYLSHEISFRGAAKTPVIISPVARSIVMSKSNGNLRLSTAESFTSLSSVGGSSVNLSQYSYRSSKNVADK